MAHSLCAFFRSSIGKKIIVAVSGLAIMLWLLGHMLGNLQVFMGPGSTVEETRINQYAVMLKANPALLWGVRLGLLTMVALHVVFTVLLTRQNAAARPVGYQRRERVKSTLASSTMIYGGLTLLAYIVYHLMHLTLGNAHPGLYVEGDVYGNLIRGFQVPAIAAAYVVAQVALFMHLSHGARSVPRTLGLSNPKHLAVTDALGLGFAVVVCLGFVAIPVAVFAGMIS